VKVKINGIELNCTVQGSGPWVVMSHSLACDLHMWDPQATLLANDYTVLRFDTRGHGKSDAPAGEYTLDMLAEDAHGLLDAMGIKSCHWIGLSMGGMIGQVFALRYPGLLRSLVLADTTSRYPAEAKSLWDGRIATAGEKGMDPLVEGTLARWFTEAYRGAHREVCDRVAAMIRATPVPGYVGCCHAIPKINVTQRLKEIACPAMVIVGEQDAGTPVAMAREIHAAMPGSELVIIPSAAHLSNLEQPEAFNRAISGFLKAHR
jgi:3-oxoadipate enol-lactonase